MYWYDQLHNHYTPRTTMLDLYGMTHQFTQGTVKRQEEPSMSVQYSAVQSSQTVYSVPWEFPSSLRGNTLHVPAPRDPVRAPQCLLSS